MHTSAIVPPPLPFPSLRKQFCPTLAGTCASHMQIGVHNGEGLLIPKSPGTKMFRKHYRNSSPNKHCHCWTNTQTSYCFAGLIPADIKHSHGRYCRFGFWTQRYCSPQGTTSYLHLAKAYFPTEAVTLLFLSLLSTPHPTPDSCLFLCRFLTGSPPEGEEARISVTSSVMQTTRPAYPSTQP